MAPNQDKKARNHICTDNGTSRQLPNQGIPLWKKICQLYLAYTNPFGSIANGIREVGDIFALDVAFELYVVVCNPRILSMLNKDVAWNLTGQMRIATEDTHPTRHVTGDFLLLTEGYYHKYFRNFERKQFTREGIDGYIKVLTKNLEEVSGKWQPSQRVDFQAASYEISFHSISRGLFGVSLGNDELTRYTLARTKVLRLSRLYMLLGPIATSPFSPFAIGYRRISKKSRDDILAGVTNAKRCPLASGLVHEFKNSEAKKIDYAFGESKIINEMTGYLAASESVASTVCWAIRILLARPDLIDKIREEANLFIDLGQDLSIQYQELLYTRSIVLETLRMYPPFPMIRMLTIEEMVFNGFAIPPKVWLMVPIFNIHRDPRWFKDPQLFLPERWASNTWGVDQSMSFIPFGLGHHRCIAWELAIAEISIQIAYLFHRYEVQSASPLKPYPIAEIPYAVDGINLKLKDKLFLILSRREPVR